MCRLHVQPLPAIPSTLPTIQSNILLQSATIAQEPVSNTTPRSSLDHPLSIDKGPALIRTHYQPEPSTNHRISRPTLTRRIAIIVLKTLIVVCHFVLCATLAYTSVMRFKVHNPNPPFGEVLVLNEGVGKGRRLVGNGGSFGEGGTSLVKRGPDIHPNQFRESLSLSESPRSAKE